MSTLNGRVLLLNFSYEPLGIGLEHLLLCHYAESRPAWRKYLDIEGVPLPERRESA